MNTSSTSSFPSSPSSPAPRLPFILLGLFGLLVFGLAACSGSSGSVQDAPSYDLSGKWVGSFVSQTGGRGTTQLTIQQSGSTLSGSFESESSCTGGGKLTGTISGDTLSGSVTAGAVHADLDGTVVSADQIDGTYSLAQAGACPTDSGSFHFTR